MRKLTTWILLLLSVALAAPALAAPTAEERARVRHLLSAYDRFPTAEQMKEAAEDPVAILLELAADGSSSILQTRAVDALGLFEGARVAAPLRQIAAGAGKDTSLLRHSLQALGRSQGSDSAKDLEPYLRHAEPTVRAAAVSALAGFGGAPGRAALDRHRAGEKNPTVLGAYRSALRGTDATPPVATGGLGKKIPSPASGFRPQQ